MRYVISLSVLILFATSCVTLSREQCQTMNWFERGKSDGMSGYEATRIADYQKDCSKFGMGVNSEQYYLGRAQGLITFCTFERGEAYGRAGHYYLGVCPTQLESEFLKGYRIGKREADARRRERELREREAELEKREREKRARHWKIGNEQWNIGADKRQSKGVLGKSRGGFKPLENPSKSRLDSRQQSIKSVPESLHNSTHHPIHNSTHNATHNSTDIW